MTKENKKLLRRGYFSNKREAYSSIFVTALMMIMGVAFRNSFSEPPRKLLLLRGFSRSSAPSGYRDPQSFITWCHGANVKISSRCPIADQIIPVTEDLEVFQLQLRRAMDARRNMMAEEHAGLAAAFSRKAVRNTTFSVDNKKGAYTVYASHAHALMTTLPQLWEGKEAKNLLWLEFGVHSGASVNISAHATRDTNIVVHGFDTFTGLPEDWAGHKPKGYFDLGGNLPPVEPGVELHKGLFKDTLPGFTKLHKKDRIAGMNIDCDLYQGAIEALNMTQHMWVQGTMIHFHELQQSAASKETKFAKQEEVLALHEFMVSHPGTVMEILPVQHTYQEPVVLVVTQLPN